MEALRLVYDHWVITCILLLFSAPVVYGLAAALGGFVVRIRGK